MLQILLTGDWPRKSRYRNHLGQILAGEFLTEIFQNFEKPGGSMFALSKYTLLSERKFDSSPDGYVLDSAIKITA